MHARIITFCQCLSTSKEESCNITIFAKYPSTVLVRTIIFNLQIYSLEPGTHRKHTSFIFILMEVHAP